MNRRSQRLDNMELLNLQSSLLSEIQAKQQISEELTKVKLSNVALESKVQEQEAIIEMLQTEMEDLKLSHEQLLEQQKITDWERERNKESSLMTFLQEQFSLLNDSSNESMADEDSDNEDAVSRDDSRTDSRSDLRGPDTPEGSLHASPGNTVNLSQSSEHVYDQPWGINKTGSPAQQTKTHHFVMKTFSTPYKCSHCTSLMVGVQRQGVTCDECGFSCHVHCIEKAVSVCPVPLDQTKRPMGIDVYKGIGTAYEGYVRVPRQGGIKKGWTRQFVVLCDFKLFLYDILPDRNMPSNIVHQVLDMRDEEFTVSPVLPSDVIHANEKDIPCIFRVTSSEMNPPGSKHQVLMLAESEQERHRWVEALNELQKLLLKNKLPNRCAFQAQEVFDNTLPLMEGTYSAAVLESNRILMGTEEGLYVAQLTKDVLIRIGDKSEKKPVYQLELVPEEQLVVFISGRQRHIKLLHQSALEGYEVDPVKILESKGCHMFCAGLVRQATSCMCVAIKRTIQIYELNKTRQKHRKIEDIQVPGHVQFLEMMNERLCVGYPSHFAVYSVQGDGAPMTLLNSEDNSFNFVKQTQLDSLQAVELSSHKEYLLVFSVCGIYVDNSGRRSRPLELMWPAQPVSVSYSNPYLTVYSENAIFVYDVHTAEWVQTLCLKKTKPLSKDGSLNIINTLDSQHIVYFKNIHMEEDKLSIPEIFKGRSVNRNKRLFSVKTREDHDRSSRGSDRRTNFSHVAHMGPDQGLQALIDPPIGAGGPAPVSPQADQIQKVKQIFQPNMKSLQETQMRGARTFQHNGIARRDSPKKVGSPRPLFSNSAIPDMHNS